MSDPVLASNITRRLRVASAAAVVAALSVAIAPVLVDFVRPAAAADVPDIVKKRQATMKRMGAILGSVKNYGDGKADQATALKDAQELPALAKTIPDMFPKGTSSADLPGVSGAKPDIWDNWTEFQADAAKMGAESEKFIAVVQAGDPAKIGPALGDLNKNGCGVCHTKFRMRI